METSVFFLHTGLALRSVLEALRKTLDSNMYYFGITALDRFKGRLKDYPQYCQHIASIEHFKEFPAHLVEWVEYGQNKSIPPSKPQGPVLPPHRQAMISGGAGPAAAAGAPGGPMTSTATSSAAGGSASMTAIGTAPKATTAKAPASTSSVNTSSTIARPTVTTVGGRPSIANTTNIDTLLNARQNEKSITPSDKVRKIIITDWTKFNLSFSLNLNRFKTKSRSSSTISV